MGESKVKKIEIKRNNFKLAKNRIKKFYENESLKLTIEGVEAKGGLFNLFLLQQALFIKCWIH